MLLRDIHKEKGEVSCEKNWLKTTSSFSTGCPKVIHLLLLLFVHLLVITLEGVSSVANFITTYEESQ